MTVEAEAPAVVEAEKKSTKKKKRKKVAENSVPETPTAEQADTEVCCAAWCVRGVRGCADTTALFLFSACANCLTSTWLTLCGSRNLPKKQSNLNGAW